MNIEFVPLTKLHPYARHLRKNNHAVDRMAALIQEFGFRIPVLVRTKNEQFELIDGDLRLKAARKLDMVEVPVLVCDDWTLAQVKAFRLAVNRSATWASFDLELIALELSELKDLAFDLSLTGFDAFEIDKLLFPDAGDEISPEPTADVVSRPDDLWICDGHRVLCSDSTSTQSVARLLTSVVPVLMVTDPPYGTLTNPEWRELAGLGKQRQTGLVTNDHQVDWTAAYKLFTGDVAYVWHAGLHGAEVAMGLNAAGFEIRSQIIWAKQHFALSRGDFHWAHEPCFYSVRKGKSSNWSGDRKQTTLWEVSNLNPFGGSKEEATGHGTQKPVELMRRSIVNNSKVAEFVYDPFLGSGTTLIAAQMTGRFCYGLEIDPKYVDIIVRRWQKLTGKYAVLEGDGRKFDELSQKLTLQLEEV